MQNNLEQQQQIVDDAMNILQNMRDNLNNFINQYGTFRMLDGFSRYLISDMGYILKKSNNTLLFFKVMKDGHEKVLIKNDEGIQKWFPVYMLVAKTLIPNPNNLSNVEHIDGNKANSQVSNLRWV